MPTENRRVAAYLPKRIDDRLEAFKVERGLKGDSLALIAILEEFFGVSQEVAHLGNSEFNELSTQVNTLKAELSSLENKLFSELKSKLLSELKSELLDELKSELPKSDQSFSPPGQLSLLGLKSELSSELPHSVPSELKSELPSESLNSDGDDSSCDDLLTEPSGKLLDGSAFWSGVELSNRLKVSSPDISSRKGDPVQKFAEWSQKKDPDGLAWKRISKGKYVPIVDNSEEF